MRVIDKDGKVLWKFDDLKQPYHAMRLPTGNTLISDASNNRVIEVDLKGKIVWKSEKMQRPVAATRLPDGQRKIISISEVLGVDGHAVETNDVFVYNRRGMDEEGKILGEHAYVAESQLMERFYQFGALKRPRA